jgi:hypothetical protein
MILFHNQLEYVRYQTNIYNIPLTDRKMLEQDYEL